MSTRYVGGLITKTPPTLDPALGNAANGVFTMSQYMQAVKNATWPGFDPYFNQTVLSLHGNGTNGDQNNTFLDGSTNNFTITRNGNTTQGTFSPFSVAAGEWSNYFDGNDTLSIAQTTDLDLGSGDFTISSWVWPTTRTGNQRIIAKQAISGSWIFRLNATTGYPFLEIDGSAIVTATSAPNLNAWSHVAVVRSSNTVTIYINGTSVGSATYSGTPIAGNATAYIASNAATNEYFIGYLSNVSFIKGSAITPPAGGPTSPDSTSTTNQKLLACYSNRFVDSNTATTAKTITVAGDPKVTPFSPFAPSAAYSASTNGGSGYFDGSGDYLLTTSAAALGIGTSAFTLEGWCYFNNVDTNGAGFGTLAASADAAGDRGVSFFMTGAGAWRFRVGRSVVGQLEDFLGTTTLVAGQWYNFKIVRTSTGSNDTRVYLNGVQEAIGTSTISLNMQKFAVGICTPSDTSVAPINGYVAGVRFTNTAVSSAIPTAPPTAVSGTQYLVNFTNAGIFDNTGKNVLETVGNAQIDTGTKKYGTGSLEFDGSGDYLVMPSNADYAFGTGDFTIELWINTTTVDDDGILQISTTAGGFATSYTNGVMLAVVSGTLRYALGGSSADTSTSINNGNWRHIAMARSGSTLKVFVDGTSVASVTNTNSVTGTNLVVGGYYSTAYTLNGYIDDLRITKGVARYTANFTAQTSQWQDQ